MSKLLKEFNKIVKIVKIENEILSKKFVQDLEQFTHEKYSIKIIWITRNIRSVFSLTLLWLGDSMDVS